MPYASSDHAQLIANLRHLVRDWTRQGEGLERTARQDRMEGWDSTAAAQDAMRQVIGGCVRELAAILPEET